SVVWGLGARKTDSHRPDLFLFAKSPRVAISQFSEIRLGFWRARGRGVSAGAALLFCRNRQRLRALAQAILDREIDCFVGRWGGEVDDAARRSECRDGISDGLTHADGEHERRLAHRFAPVDGTRLSFGPEQAHAKIGRSVTDGRNLIRA